MRKISAMYAWSGGTDYRHTCNECRNCVEVSSGKRKVHKCQSYGSSASSATDWNPANIACKAFNQTLPLTPIFFTDQTKQDERLKGQMTIFDFITEEVQ